MAGQMQRCSATARLQHHVISRPQLLALGVSRHAIENMVARGRLHPLFRGVYAVGRPQVSWRGWWTAAVLACGPDAVLSHTKRRSPVANSPAFMAGPREHPGPAAAGEDRHAPSRAAGA